MRLRISGRGHLGHCYSVWLDGVEQTRVTNVVLDMGVDRVNKAQITFIVDDVEVDMEIPPPGQEALFG